MITLAAFVLLLALTAANAAIGRRLLYPAFVFSVIWCAQVGGLLLFDRLFDDPHGIALLVVVAGAYLFSAGSLIGWALMRPFKNPLLARSVFEGSVIFFGLFFIVALALVLQWQVFLDVGGAGLSGESLVKVRSAMNTGGEDVYGPLKYAYPAGLIGMLAALVRLQRRRRPVDWMLFLGFAATGLGMAVLSTGRSKVFELALISSLALLATKRLKIGIFKTAMIMVLVAITGYGVFWFMGRSMGKANVSVIRASADIVRYQLSPIPAFSEYLRENRPQLVGGEGGRNSLRFAYALGNRLGVTPAPTRLVQEFVEVPHRTNIYGIYHLYIRDFGILPALLIVLLLGGLHGVIFAAVEGRPPTDVALIIFVLSLLPILRSVGGETYLTHLSFWIQCSLYVFLLSRRGEIMERTRRRPQSRSAGLVPLRLATGNTREPKR